MVWKVRDRSTVIVFAWRGSRTVGPARAVAAVAAAAVARREQLAVRRMMGGWWVLGEVWIGSYVAGCVGGPFSPGSQQPIATRETGRRAPGEACREGYIQTQKEQN